MPHFYSHIPQQLVNLPDAQAVREYEFRADVPAKSIVGLTADQLRAKPIPGTWSIAQIILHLTDSDLIAAYRMKRIIAEDRPKLDIWAEVAFSEKLFYDEQNVAQAAELFRLNRLVLAETLRRLPTSAFSRVALHPEVGEMSLGQILRIYIHHVDHHLAFIIKKRKLLGNETPQ